jgi:nucleoside-diphosphate-sugar epimerase/predicted lipid carrier protein YhbT
MSQRDTTLITGVTGSIGSWMARAILESGRSIVALTRADTPGAARNRVLEALRVVGASDCEAGVDVLHGDVCDDRVVEAAARSCRNVSCVVHCAGALEFREEFAELGQRVNVYGTANLLRLAETLHVPFCHFSTAYIAGRRQGRVLENETDVGQGFNNPYESSKCRAELLVRDWSRRTGLAAFLFRPSIVVGDSREGRIVNFDGLYNFMRLLDGMAGLNAERRFRVVGNPAATKNIVPVDYVARVAAHILDTGPPGTYHITNPRPLRLSALCDILAEVFAVRGAILVSEEQFRSPRPNRFESMYQKLASTYAPYLASEPVFDRTNTDAVARSAGFGLLEIDMAFFRRLADYARTVKWGKAERPAAAATGTERFVERYFDEFLAEKMHRQLLPNLRKLSANCRIVVEDVPGRSWSLRIDRGCLVQISQNGLPVECTFLLHSDAFSAIVAGRLSPQAAFFGKKIDIEGDMETGLKLATVLAAFFRKWPCE